MATLTYQDQQNLKAWLNITTIGSGSIHISNSLTNKRIVDVTFQIKNGIAYYPLLCSSALSRIPTIRLKEVDEYAIGLYECECSKVNMANFKQLVKIMAIMNRFQERVVQLSLKDVCYYVGQGLILDNECNPIMMICLKEDETPDFHFTAFFSPKIITNTDDALFTGLRKYIIPFLADLEHMQTYSNNHYSADVVITKDINNFIVRQDIPQKSISEVNSELTHLGKEAVDTILSEIGAYYQNPT